MCCAMCCAGEFDSKFYLNAIHNMRNKTFMVENRLTNIIFPKIVTYDIDVVSSFSNLLCFNDVAEFKPTRYWYAELISVTT